MLELPKSIKLGTREISIDFPHVFAMEEDGSQLVGLCLFHHGEIQIAAKSEVFGCSKGLADQSIRTTLLHELLHACLLFIGRDDISADEHLVDGLSEVLRMLFKDNT